MTKNEKNRSVAKQSTSTSTSAHETCIRIIHRYVIPEHPVGLIGEKVVFADKYAKQFWDDHGDILSRVPAPYFTVIGARLEMRSRGIIVMIRVDIPGTQWQTHGIALKFFKKYEGPA
jgi:hypothetical protein